MPELLAVPDKFKGTATAAEVAAAIGRAARHHGWKAVELPLSDGGEGLVDVFGGPNRTTVVSGPLGRPERAHWRFGELSLGSAEGILGATAGTVEPTAVIEMSEAAGLVLAGGADHNDPEGATTAGVGQLIGAAVDAGARRLIIGCGGSATTDGGLGALEALGAFSGGAQVLASVSVIVACDVSIGFLEAAKRFGPQKGASAAQVVRLEARLGSLADRYLAEFGVDVRSLPGSGAAGGLAGGLGALGGRLVAGLDLVAALVGLDARLGRAEAVVTGEGRLDDQSFAGKVVGEVARRALATGPEKALLCVAGRATREGVEQAEAHGLRVVDLESRFGEELSTARATELVTVVVSEWLARVSASSDQPVARSTAEKPIPKPPASRQ